jgi:hypothetical protein
MPTDADPTLVPGLVRAFIARHRLNADSIRSEGRVVLTIDNKYRVHIFPAPHNRIALQSELVTLPDHPSDDILLKLANTGAGLMQRHGSTLCIDRKREALVLQEVLPAASDMETLQKVLADFANALDFWSGMCRTVIEAFEAPPQRVPEQGAWMPTLAS